MGCLKINFQNANNWYHQNIATGGVDGKSVDLSHCVLQLLVTGYTIRWNLDLRLSMQCNVLDKID